MENILPLNTSGTYEYIMEVSKKQKILPKEQVGYIGW